MTAAAVASRISSHAEFRTLMIPMVPQSKPMSDPYGPCGMPSYSVMSLSRWRKICHGKRPLSKVIPDLEGVNDGPTLKRTCVHVKQLNDDDGTSGGEADDSSGAAHAFRDDLDLEDILDAETLILGQVDGCDMLHPASGSQNDVANLDDLAAFTIDAPQQQRPPVDFAQHLASEHM